MTARGEYRPVHTVLLDSPEFLDLSPEAQLVFFHLKLRLGPTGIEVLPAMTAVLSETTGYPPDAIGDAIGDLIGRGWIMVERNVVWLRNGLRYEPSRSISNENHRKSVEKHIAGLPKLKIVNDFADYYDLERPFPDEWDTPCHTPSHADGIPDHGIRNTETETETEGEEPLSLRSREPSPSAAAVGVFLEKTGAEWRLQSGIREWCDEIDREPKYAGADVPYEIRKCADWHVGRSRTPKAPDISIRNWLERAAEDAQAQVERKAKTDREAYLHGLGISTDRL